MQLPPRFHKTIGLLRSADLLLVIGTSLTVHPFASLTQLVPEGCPRVLVNMTPAGDIGERVDDVTLLGRSDDVVRELCAALGDDWVQELDAMWAETAKYAQSEEGEVRYDMQILADKIEFCWIHLRGIGALENSLWGYDGQSIRVWLNALAIEAPSPVEPDSEDREPDFVKESVNIPLDFYPMCKRY